MYSPRDKSEFKVALVRLQSKDLSQDELEVMSASLLTFLNSLGLMDVYWDWKNYLKKEFRDEEIRIAMLEEAAEHE